MDYILFNNCRTWWYGENITRENNLMRKIILILLFGAIQLLMAQEILDLEDCIKHALKNNPDMAISGKQMQIADQGVVNSFGNLLPNVRSGFSSQFSKQGPSDYVQFGQTVTTPESNSEYHSFGVTANQTLFNGGSNINNYRYAKNQKFGYIVSDNQTRQMIITDVTDKFYTVLKSKELLKVYKKSHNNSIEQLKKTEEMQKLGKVALKDVLKAKVKEGGDRLNIIRQKTNLKTAIANLNTSMGISSDKMIDIEEKIYIPVEDISQSTAQEYCMKNNTELKLLEIQKKSAGFLLSSAKGAYLPDLSMSMRYGRGGPEFNRSYSEIDKWWNTSVTLSVGFSIFEGFKNRSNIQSKKIEIDIADDQIRKKKMEIAAKVNDFIRSLETYKQMLEINELNMESAREDLRLAQEMYRLNSVTFLEVLDAQVAFTRAESDIISTKYDAKIVEVQLKYVMGTL